MNGYSPEVILELFGQPVGWSESVHFVDGKAFPILVVQTPKVEDANGSVNEHRSTIAIAHMNAFLGLLDTKLTINGTGIGLELPIGALIDFSDVYTDMVSALSEKGVRVTFFVTMDDESAMDVHNDIMQAIISQMINLGCDFAVDNIHNADDFKKVEHFFQLITKVRLNKEEPDHELIAHLSAREIKAIQDIN